MSADCRAVFVRAVLDLAVRPKANMIAGLARLRIDDLPITSAARVKNARYRKILAKTRVPPHRDFIRPNRKRPPNLAKQTHPLIAKDRKVHRSPFFGNGSRWRPGRVGGLSETRNAFSTAPGAALSIRISNEQSRLTISRSPK